MKATFLIVPSFLFLACGGESAPPQQATVAATTPVGDAQMGKQLIDQYACLACHHIPGFEEPHGSMGPSLAGTATRPMIAGRVPNNPQTMIAYLQNPPAVDPATRMPPLGVSEDEARHMTAYLFTLK